MPIAKRDLIRLVRQAQAERDPKKREELWERVRAAGLPYDATIEEPVTDRNEERGDEGN